MKSVVLGARGQDGLNLTRYLSGLPGQDVLAVVRGQMSEREAELRSLPSVTTLYCDVADHHSVDQLIGEHHPEELYCLSALSSAKACEERPTECWHQNTSALLGILEACRRHAPKCRIFQASSVLCYGNREGTVCLEEPFSCNSHYESSKAASHNLIRLYRKRYGLYAVAAALYPHESLERPPIYLMRAISMHLARCYVDPTTPPMKLYGPKVLNDWGWSCDFVKAYRAALQSDEPRDYVIGTGVLEPLEYTVGLVAERLGLDAQHTFRWEPYHHPGGRPHSPEDWPEGWSPEVVGSDVLWRMVQHDLEVLRSN